MSPPSLSDLVSFDLTGLKLHPQGTSRRVCNIQWVLFQIDFVHNTPRDIFSDDSVWYDSVLQQRLLPDDVCLPLGGIRNTCSHPQEPPKGSGFPCGKRLTMTSSDVEISSRLDFPSPPRSHQDATKSRWKERNAPPPPQSGGRGRASGWLREIAERAREGRTDARPTKLTD